MLWGFINDITRSSPDELENKYEKTRQHLQSMYAKTQSAGIQPIIATEVTITAPPSLMNSIKAIIGSILGKESYQEKINKHVSEINDWLKQQAQQQNLLVLDFEKVLAAPNGQRKKEYVTEDGSHITSKAYDALTAYTDQKLPKL